MTRLQFYHYIKQFILYFPTPTSFVLGVLSLTGPSYICGQHGYEMSLMWFLMSLAHSKVYIDFVEQYFCPNKHKH
jgi:hypothetical protein